ncbi:MAG: carboxypeptidase regulatory-like domain-containing protein [Candidatus Acidiferrum sp.]
MLNWNKWQIGLVALLLCAIALPAWAQLDTGSIVGVVQDKSGAVVPDAKVTVTNLKTGRVYEVQTNPTGEYEVPGLPAGLYKVVAEHEGFKTRVVDGIVLYATDRRAVNATLDVGQTSENVTVTADVTTVNTQTSEAGATIDNTEVQNLPLNGRDFTNLMTLVPGSVITGGFGQTSLGGYETSLAGVNILLDGADATRIDSQATSTQLGRQDSRINRVSVDSIDEFKVMSGNYSAEYGRSYGDIVNVITKSGSNTLHGGVFEYIRNDYVDAKNYFQTGPAPFHLNQFGGSISGPLIKDKLFFFFNYEGVRQSTHSPVFDVPVMTAATRALAVPDMVPVVNSLPLPNPALGPAIFPNPSGGPPIVRNDLGLYDGSEFETDREDTGSLKIDYRITQKDSLALRYNIDSSFTNTQYGVAADQVSPSPGLNHLLKATWDHTLRASLLNEFGVAYNRPKTDSLGGGGPFPFFQCSAFWGCGNSNTFGDAPGPALFSESQPEHSLQFLDTLTWIKGRHSIAAGFDIRHAVTQNALIPQNFIAYDSEADFLANQGDQFSTLGHNMVDLENTNYDFFIQDDFRVTPRLTLNLGVRYEYNTVLTGHLIQNFNLAALYANSTSTNTAQFFGPLGAGLYKPDRNNFGPRIGFSWDPYGAGKTVIRGGFGIFYNPQLTGAALSLAGNYQQGYNLNILDFFFVPNFSCTPDFNQPPVPYYYISYPLPNPLPVCTPTPPPNVNSLDPNLRDSYSMHWSLGVQQEIARSTIFELSYVANRGVKLPGGAAYAGEELNLSPFGGTEITPNFGNVRFLGDFLESNYHSLQASLRRHVSKGLVIDANFTWAHELDDGVNIITSAYQNSHNPKGDYANGDIDVRRNFTLGTVYDVPTARLLPKVLGQGWQMTSIIEARSGLPFPIEVAAPFLGEDQLRPNLVPGQSLRPANYSVPGNQINLAAISGPCSATNTSPYCLQPNSYGTTPRNAGRGPGFTQIDFGLSKRTTVNEHYGLQLGATAFNILNHPNFANPAGILENDLTFGQSTSTVGNKVGPGTARQFQVFVRMTF